MNTLYHLKNRRAWNQAATAYRKELPKTVEFLRSGGVSMCSVELPFLKEALDGCDTAIHLQCAGGEDTLSLLNLGVRKVMGIDISEEMIRIAQETSAQLQAQATWLCCDVLEVPASLDETADLVYTGRGAINWIHDLNRWAATVKRLLKPGKAFYLFEGHPVTYFFDPQADELRLDPECEGYFSKKVYTNKEWPEEYVGNLGIPANELAETYERAWPISEVITALLDHDLRLTRFHEHPDAYWTEFPHLPEKERCCFPNTYSLLMRKELYK